MGSEKEGEKVEKLLELANPVVDYLERPSKNGASFNLKEKKWTL